MSKAIIFNLVWSLFCKLWRLNPEEDGTMIDAIIGRFWMKVAGKIFNQ